jgi:hypothetical protein
MKSRKSEPVLDGRAITGPRTMRDPRSREYAVQTMFSLKGFLDSNTFNAKYVERELEEIKTYKHREVLGFERLDDYLKAELGMNQRQLKSRLAKDLAADPNVKPARDEKGGRPKKGENLANSEVLPFGSTSAARIVARLKRDHQEIAEALARGEYPSARAAGIAAGIVKEQSALDKIRKLWARLAHDERAELLNELMEEEYGSTNKSFSG